MHTSVSGNSYNCMHAILATTTCLRHLQHIMRQQHCWYICATNRKTTTTKAVRIYRYYQSPVQLSIFQRNFISFHFITSHSFAHSLAHSFTRSFLQLSVRQPSTVVRFSLLDAFFFLRFLSLATICFYFAALWLPFFTDYWFLMLIQRVYNCEGVSISKHLMCVCFLFIFFCFECNYMAFGWM